MSSSKVFPWGSQNHMEVEAKVVRDREDGEHQASRQNKIDLHRFTETDAACTGPAQIHD